VLVPVKAVVKIVRLVGARGGFNGATTLVVPGNITTLPELVDEVENTLTCTTLPPAALSMLKLAKPACVCTVAVEAVVAETTVGSPRAI